MADRDGDAEPSVPAALHDEPESAQRLYVALFVTGPATTQSLADETGLSRRTVVTQLSNLEDCGLVESRPDFGGGSRWQYIFSLTGDGGDADGTDGGESGPDG